MPLLEEPQLSVGEPEEADQVVARERKLRVWGQLAYDHEDGQSRAIPFLEIQDAGLENVEFTTSIRAVADTDWKNSKVRVLVNPNVVSVIQEKYER